MDKMTNIKTGNIKALRKNADIYSKTIDVSYTQHYYFTL